jgi:hypothetical protein
MLLWVTLAHVPTALLQQNLVGSPFGLLQLDLVWISDATISLSLSRFSHTQGYTLRRSIRSWDGYGRHYRYHAVS